MLFVSLSLVLLIGIAVAVFIRFMGLKLWMAVICVVFGFLLHETSFGPVINRILAAFAGFITGH